MNPFTQLMQAGAFIMLLFAAVLTLVVLRNVKEARRRARWGPIVIGASLILFAMPIYASVTGTRWFDRFSPAARIVAAILLPVGLYLLTALSQHNWRLGVGGVDGDAER